MGSPPRVRGKPNMISINAYAERITPARAGKTRECDDHHHQGQDHPRACGENTTGDMLRIALQGSPPRVRGKHGFSPCLCSFTRITPARAGKT